MEIKKKTFVIQFVILKFVFRGTPETYFIRLLYYF